MNYEEIDIFDDVTWTDPVSTTEIFDADKSNKFVTDTQQVLVSTAFEDQSR